MMDRELTGKGQTSAPSQGGPVDIGALLDSGPWNSYQKSVLGICALAVVLDAIDNQAFAFVIPAILAEWQLERSDFSFVLALGLLSMSVGTAIAGVLGDRLGRRVALIGSVFVFGTCTMALSTVNSMTGLCVFRALAGLGIGGAIPNAAALISEFTPIRRRALAVTMGIVCVPVGGTIGGIIAAGILPNYGWRALFLVAGMAAVIVGLILIAVLPESPRYLVRRSDGRKKLAEIIRRFGYTYPADTEFVDSEEEANGRATIVDLVRGKLRRDTLVLWGAFFSCLLATYTLTSWTPLVLTEGGHSLGVSSAGLAAFNFGGIFGALGGAWLITRYGSKMPLLLLTAGGALGAVMMVALPVLSSTEAWRVVVAFAIEGALVNGAQTTLFALAAHVYPTSVRSSGVGAALAVGRGGAILSSFTGAATLAWAGTQGFFAVVTVALLVTFLCLLTIRRHIPRFAG